MWYSTETKAAQIGLTAMFSVLTITDIAGNAIVCLLIIKFKDMRLVTGEAFIKQNNHYDKGWRVCMMLIRLIHSIFIGILFFRSRLNILIFLPILG